MKKILAVGLLLFTVCFTGGVYANTDKAGVGVTCNYTAYKVIKGSGLFGKEKIFASHDIKQGTVDLQDAEDLADKLNSIGYTTTKITCDTEKATAYLKLVFKNTK